MPTCTVPEDLVDDDYFPMEVAEVMKYVLVSVCSFCCPHMAFFRWIIMLSSVFCVFGSGHPSSAVLSLLKQPCFCCLIQRFLVPRSSLSSDAMKTDLKAAHAAVVAPVAAQNKVQKKSDACSQRPKKHGEREKSNSVWLFGGQEDERGSTMKTHTHCRARSVCGWRRLLRTVTYNLLAALHCWSPGHLESTRK